MKVSKEAADLAIAVDKMARHPDLARQLAPAIEALKQSSVLIETIERMSGRACLNELIKKQFPQP